jgi:hypothetical protein
MILSLTAESRKMTHTVNGKYALDYISPFYEGLHSSALACFPHYLRVPASEYTLSVVLVL